MSIQAPEQQYADQAGQRRQVKRRGHRITERTRRAAEQRAAADPGHHAAGQQGEVSGALRGCHQACHDDRPQGVEHAPAQAQQQAEKQQQMTEARGQGEAQAGRYQQYTEQRHRAGGTEQVGQMTGNNHRCKGAEHCRRNHTSGVVFVTAARTNQQRQQKRRAVGQ
ncbi:hypothetical protein D3C71_1340650 [compost metagenome]